MCTCGSAIYDSYVNGYGLLRRSTTERWLLGRRQQDVETSVWYGNWDSPKTVSYDIRTFVIMYPGNTAKGTGFFKMGECVRYTKMNNRKGTYLVT